MNQQNEPNFQAGIYNYCDHWCEKCSKTSRCLLYSKEEDGKVELIARGIDPETPEGALKMVANSFEETISLIHETCEKEGIDLEMNPEEEEEFRQLEILTDPKNLPAYKAANKIFLEIGDWLKSVPSLDIPEYRIAYENVGWHHSLIFVKTARSLSSYLEFQHEDDEMAEHSLDDAIKSGWVAFRSTNICMESFELMNGYVRDSRITPIINKCKKLIVSLQKHIDDLAKFIDSPG